MPHIVVKLWPGRNDEIKNSLAQKIANAVVEELKVDIGDVSVVFEEVSRSNWGERVYKKEIKDNPNVCLKPNYEYEWGMLVTGYFRWGTRHVRKETKYAKYLH